MAKTLIGNVKGPKGDKGDKGATGATGPAGATGAQGPKGDTGAAFTYDMFTAAQLAALKGPTGATGPKGDKGDKGDTGPAGAAGAAGQPGEDGQRGTGILNTTSGVSSYTTAVGGVTPAYRILLSTLKTQAKVDEVLVGDSVRYSYFIYPVIYVDDTYAYMGTRVSIRGATGAAGAAGADGAAGAPGADATIESVTAEVDGSYLAQPTVNVTTGGTPSNRTFHFAFKGLRGLSGGGSGGGGTTVQADLSVNDPNDPSYVKERTHWKEVFDGPEGEIVPETSVSFLSSIASVTGTANGVQIGGKYIVTYNGADYECIGRDSGDGAYIGNGSLLNYGNLADTGEPFCILAFTSTMYQIWKPDSTKETITVKVVGKKETVWHKLDSRFLNEALQFGETVTIGDTQTWDGNTAGLVSVVIDEGAGFCKVSDFVPTEEDCVNGLMMTVGTTSVGLEFTTLQMYFQDDGFMFAEYVAFVPADNYYWADLEMTFPEAGIYFVYADGIYLSSLVIPGCDGLTKREVKKLNGKFLPDGLPYAEKGTVEILPEITVEIDPESGEGALFDVVNVKAGNFYTVKWNGIEFFCEAKLMTGDIPMVVLGNVGVVNGGASTSEPFVIGCLDAETAAAMGAGAILMALDGAASVTLSICNAIIHPLPPMYLKKMTVNFTQNENGDWVSDKTYAEVEEAIANGYTVDSVAYDGTLYRYMPLVVRGTIGVFFCSALVLDGVVTHTTVTLSENGVTYATVIK